MAGRGRGRAAILPAWVTDPSLAREAQQTSSKPSDKSNSEKKDDNLRSSVQPRASRFDQDRSEQRKVSTGARTSVEPRYEPSRRGSSRHSDRRSRPSPSPRNGKRPRASPERGGRSIERLRKRVRSSSRSRSPKRRRAPAGSASPPPRRCSASSSRSGRRIDRRRPLGRSRSPAPRTSSPRSRSPRRSPVIDAVSLCNRLHEIRDCRSTYRRRQLAESFDERFVDREDFWFEDVHAKSYTDEWFFDVVLLGTSKFPFSLGRDFYRLSQQASVRKNRSTSYCIEMETASSSERGRPLMVVLYEERGGKLTRCFQLEEENRDQLLQDTKAWCVCRKYLLKKGVAPSMVVNHMNCKTGDVVKVELGENTASKF